MRYRIDFYGDRQSLVVNSRKDLLDWLKLLHPNTIEDIRKLYNSGVSDSVIDVYDKYISAKEKSYEQMKKALEEAATSPKAE